MLSIASLIAVYSLLSVFMITYSLVNLITAICYGIFRN
jgi:hypothetical protein